MPDQIQVSASGISPALKQQIIDKYVHTSNGRRVLAASLTQPLRLRRDYSAVGRRAFEPEQLPDGALAVYDKDPEVAAYVIGDDGMTIQALIKPRRVNVPLFDIATAPMIPLQQIKERRYDLIDRTMDLAKAQVQATEDERVFAIFNAVSEAGFDGIAGQTNPDIPVVAPISGQVIADAFALIERHNLRVVRIFINARDYADVRKFGREILDFETQRTLLNTGLLGTMYGAQIIQSVQVPVGTVYVIAEPLFLGRLPIRTELTVLSADDPIKRLIGFSIFETLGFLCHNPLAIVRLIVTR